ncbi:lipopolysaccharide biosynthesis protein RfbH [bacterium]
MTTVTKKQKLVQEILEKTKEYYKAIEEESKSEFVPKTSRVNYAGRVFDEKEMMNLVDSSLEFWLTYGRYSKMFEEKLAKFLGVKSALLVNSGSSANLLAFMALTSPLLKDRRINRGDEVITIACGFPTTMAPIVQYGALPVFIDIDLETANIDVNKLDSALSDKTKAVMIAHTLGNPFDIAKVKEFCKKNSLWLIEDNCDALGSVYNGKYTGTWGDIGTSSFYPPHHMTMGEGGAVYTNDALLKKILLSVRDWGRDCWCDSGADNTCGQRFSQQFGTLPFGYDHKYVYSHFGYNLKPTDMQAAIGCAQLDKLEGFIQKRRENFQVLYDGLNDLSEYFVLPKATDKSEPSWFGFLITLKDGISFKRNDLAEFLEGCNIQTRNLFGGNMVRQPLFDDLELGKDYRVVGDLTNTDKIMNDSFWVGVYPGMKKEALEYIVSSIKEFVANNK